jgi:hypothetical protein
MTETDVANLALYQLGDHGALVNLATDTTPQARKVRLFYEPRRDALQRMFPWNFCIARSYLTPVFVAITSLTNSSGKVLVTHNSHGLNTGDRVTIKDVAGITANGTWRITVLTNHTYTLDGSAFSGTVTATGSYHVAPNSKWAYRYPKPNDCLRVHQVNGNYASVRQPDFDLEGDYIVTDAATVELRYTAKQDDPEKWDALFLQAFVHDLAASLAIPLSQSTALRQMIESDRDKIIQQARASDAFESESWVILPSQDTTTADVRAGLWDAV